MFEKIIQENGGEIMREEIGYEMALKINEAAEKQETNDNVLFFNYFRLNGCEFDVNFETNGHIYLMSVRAKV